MCNALSTSFQVKVDHTGQLNNLSNNSSHAQHQTYIGNHSQTILIKNLATNFTVPSKIGPEDQLSSNPMPMVHKGVEKLVKNYILLAKKEK